MEGFRHLLSKNETIVIENQRVKIVGIQLSTIHCDVMYLVHFNECVQVMPLYTLARILEGFYHDDKLFTEKDVRFNVKVTAKLEI